MYAPTIRASCDFTTRGTGLFACYVAGHTHADSIVYSNKYPKQKAVVCVTSNLSSMASINIPRMLGTKSEDALTALSIDTTHKTINIVRVGAAYTTRLQDKTVCVVPYDVDSALS